MVLERLGRNNNRWLNPNRFKKNRSKKEVSMWSLLFIKVCTSFHQRSLKKWNKCRTFHLWNLRMRKHFPSKYLYCNYQRRHNYCCFVCVHFEFSFILKNYACGHRGANLITAIELSNLELIYHFCWLQEPPVDIVDKMMDALLQQVQVCVIRLD